MVGSSWSLYCVEKNNGSSTGWHFCAAEDSLYWRERLVPYGHSDLDPFDDVVFKITEPEIPPISTGAATALLVSSTPQSLTIDHIPLTTL